MSFQNGVLKGDDLKRYTGRINLDWDVTSVLKFGTNVSLAYTDQSQEGQGLWQIKQFRPDVPVYAEDGSYYKIGTTDNPVATNIIPVFYRKVIIITIIPVKLYGEVTNRYVPFGIIH